MNVLFSKSCLGVCVHMILFQSVEEECEFVHSWSQSWLFSWWGCVCNEQDFLKANGPVMCKAQRSSAGQDARHLIRCLNFFFFFSAFRWNGSRLELNRWTVWWCRCGSLVNIYQIHGIVQFLFQSWPVLIFINILDYLFILNLSCIIFYHTFLIVLVLANKTTQAK